jgi:predicted transcriptional regulator
MCNLTIRVANFNTSVLAYTLRKRTAFVPNMPTELEIKPINWPQSTINQRLSFIVNSLNMKVGPFSRAIGLSETTVRNYTDRNSKPSSDVLAKIVSTFDQVNLVWLVMGKGEPFLPVTSSKVPQPTFGTFRKAIGTAVTEMAAEAKANSKAVSADANSINSMPISNCEEKLKMAEQSIEQLKSQLKDKERIIQLLEQQLNK